MGFRGIVETFGDPRPFVEHPASWEVETLALRTLPFGLPYAGLPGTMIRRIRAHKLVVDLFVEALAEAWERVRDPQRLTFGGIYAFRPQRGGATLSTHTWGIAIDIDPERNPRGRKYDGGEKMLHPAIVESFCSRGFVWGETFKVKDCMHLQLARGY